MLPVAGFSGYELRELLHQGTNTIIYRAKSTTDRRVVILKILKFDYPNLEKIARLKYEYQIAKDIESQYVIKTYRLETHQKNLVLVLEDIAGISLDRWIANPASSLKLTSNQKFEPASSKANDRISLEQFFQISLPLAKALIHLHQQQIIHKDIKPANIIFNPQTQQVKLTDFSIASRLDREHQNLKNPARLEATLAYMSPEQTGRMNRAIDYLSDFYSLGVTFYELLTGKLPFQSTDPLELVHCHIAKQPVPIQQLNPEIPLVLAQIVTKLMAKNAEDRYQSAAGLLADLERCQNEFNSVGTISNFIPGQLEAMSQLSIPQKLYGREKQVAELLQVFDRVRQGSSEIVLVSGYSGIGKSALVHEIMRNLTRHHGYFISGKFDQYKRNIPYDSFNQAVRSLVNQILMSNPTDLAQWRQILSNALGANARVAIDAIPELELILGALPTVPELDALESQNRFNRVMQQFLQAVATAEHPLVMFMDDCQWMDSGTINMYQNNWMQNNPYFLNILAYRDNEVSLVHPFMVANEAIQAAGIPMTLINLKPLAIADVKQLVCETFNCSESRGADLGDLLASKTDGNPFFLRQLVKFLYQKNWIKFNFKKTQWQWDIQEIEQQQVSENVIDLMVKKIQTLSEASQRILQLAACIDNQFSWEMLSIASEQSLTKTARGLWEALQLGLILPLDNTYRLPQVLDGQELEKLGKKGIQVRYKFLHDRVQQAAYQMIPDSQKQPVHLKLGRLLLQATGEAERQKNIFNIVNHLNLARNLIANSAELYELADLNLQAGKLAKAAAAFESAKIFFVTGCDCLPDNCWEENYALSFSLYLARGEAEYLNGNNDEALAIFDSIVPQTHTLLELCLIKELKMICMRMKNDLAAAYSLGVQTLQALGIDFEAYPDEDFLANELAKTKAMIGPSIADLADLPKLTDPQILAAHRILKELFPIAYFTNPNGQFLCAMKLVQASIEYGNSPISAFGYTLYAFTLVTKYREIVSGCAAGKLSIALYERWNITELGAQIFHMWGALTLHYIKYIDECKILILKAFNNGLETGAYQWSGYASVNYLWVCFFGNEYLPKSAQIIDEFIPVLSKVDRNMLAYHLLNKNAIAQLTCLPATEVQFPTFIDEQALLEFARSSADLTTAFIIYVYKLTIANWFGEVDKALEYALAGAEFLKGGAGHFVNPVFRFHHAIALAAACTKASQSDRQLYRKQLQITAEEFRDLALHCPANYEHKYLLIQAEIARLSQDNYAAAEYYDRSIVSAIANNFIQNAALANELAARFYLAQNRPNLAKSYLNDARFCYLQWGATAKVDRLEQLYAGWFQNLSDNAIAPTTTVTTSPESNILDLGTVIKSSQAISSEIVLEKLLKKLLHIILENAGAEIGCILLEKNGQMFVEVWDTQQQHSTNFWSVNLLKSTRYLPMLIINYVTVTQESVVLNDAAKSRIYQSDPYIQKNQSKSILCAPILYQGKSLGIVYLENNLVAGAFSSDRLKLLQILTSQAAIALENARLYAAEQEKSYQLAESVKQLQQSQVKIAQKEKQYRSIFESVADGVLLVELDTAKIVAANPAICEMYGYSQEDFLTLIPSDLLPPNNLHIFDSFLKTVRARQEFYCQAVVVRKDGTKFDLEARAKFFEYKGKPHALSIMRDISDRKRYEKALQTSESELREKAANLEITILKLQQTQAQLVQTEKIAQLGQLVAGVAHEVNNPISFISGNLHHVQGYVSDLMNLLSLYQNKFTEPGLVIAGEIEAIELEYLLADLLKTIDSMKLGIDRIRDIMQSLRNYSRTDSTQKRAADLHEGIETTLMILSHRLKANQDRPAIKVIKYYGDLPKINCYPGKLNQVFMNLIANAIDALSESNAGKTYAEIEKNLNTITISTVATSAQKQFKLDTLVIRIADSGLGMPESVREKLFTPFFTTKVAGEGTGLGLSICHQIITEEHGGTLECLSSLGEGTEFVITIPI